MVLPLGDESELEGWIACLVETAGSYAEVVRTASRQGGASGFGIGVREGLRGGRGVAPYVEPRVVSVGEAVLSFAHTSAPMFAVTRIAFSGRKDIM